VARIHLKLAIQKDVLLERLADYLRMLELGTGNRRIWLGFLVQVHNGPAKSSLGPVREGSSQRVRRARVFEVTAERTAWPSHSRSEPSVWSKESRGCVVFVVVAQPVWSGYAPTYLRDMNRAGAASACRHSGGGCGWLLAVNGAG
jgi:hypothetical protein